jgi:hypothetical protein
MLWEEAIEPRISQSGKTATKGIDHGLHGLHGWERRTRNLDGIKKEFHFRVIRVIRGKIAAELNKFFL